MIKQCVACPAEYDNGSTRKGKPGRCPPCAAHSKGEASARWRGANREIVRTYARNFQAKWRAENPERNRDRDRTQKANAQEKRRAWRQANPHLVHMQNLRNKYKVSTEVLEQLFQSQGGLCAACHQVLDPSIRRGWESTSLDHDHATGRLRGFVHQRCNFGIGQFLDDSDALRLASHYLLGAHANDVHNYVEMLRA